MRTGASVYILPMRTTINPIPTQSCDYRLRSDYSPTVFQTLEMSLTLLTEVNKNHKASFLPSGKEKKKLCSAML